MGEVPDNYRKADVTADFKKDEEDLEDYKQISLTLNPGKMVEQLILESISRHMKAEKVIRSSQHGFIKLCMINWINYYNEISGFLD